MLEHDCLHKTYRIEGRGSGFQLVEKSLSWEGLEMQKDVDVLVLSKFPQPAWVFLVDEPLKRIL